MAIAGCGSDGPSTPVPLSAAPTPGKADAPQICNELADSASIRGLGESIPRIVAGAASSDDREQASRATARLRELAMDPQSATGLAAQLEAAASAVDSLVGAATPTQDQANAVANAFAALDMEVQAACEFPLG